MAKDKQDELARAYAMLSSLRKNVELISIAYGVEELYVREFHAVLDKLESVGTDVSEFRIQSSEVTPKISSRSTSYLDGSSNTSYTSIKYVDKPYFLTKLDAVLGYFEIITSDKPRSIGFHSP